MLPVTNAAPIVILFPIQIPELGIVAAAGSGLTVIITALDFIHPFELVSVTVYVVVIVGEAEGLAEAEEKPTGLLTQEYVLPVTAVAPIVIDAPIQMLEFAMVAAAGNGLTVMVTELDFIQLLEFVSIRV
jgi:hypothetical protein